MKKKVIKAKLDKTKKKLVKIKSKLTDTIAELEAVKKKAQRPSVVAKKPTRAPRKPLKKRTPLAKPARVALTDLLPDSSEKPADFVVEEKTSPSGANGR